MNFVDLRAEYYLFKKTDFGRIYVFVDFGNVRPWAKELWPDKNKFRINNEIDIEKLARVINWVSPVKKYFIMVVILKIQICQMTMKIIKNIVDQLFV